jgi:hypothetical protein
MLVFVAAASAETIQGSYIEARSTGQPAAIQSATGPTAQRADHPCQAILAWQIGHGAYEGQKLDGQTIIAVVTTELSPGASVGRTKTVLFVDGRASTPVREALAHLAKGLAPAVIHDAGEIVPASIDVRIAEGCGCGAAVVECPLAKLRTRRMTDADRGLVVEVKTEKPLGDVFSSNQVIATEFTCNLERPAGAGSFVVAFTGSFAK